MKTKTLGTLPRVPTLAGTNPNEVACWDSWSESDNGEYEQEERELQYEACGGGRRIVRKRIGE